ncbi:MAG: hypothetical protein V1881_04040 [Candidatus Micrarchaeota archaeon]
MGNTTAWNFPPGEEGAATTFLFMMMIIVIATYSGGLISDSGLVVGSAAFLAVPIALVGAMMGSGLWLLAPLAVVFFGKYYFPALGDFLGDGLYALVFIFFVAMLAGV